MIRTITYLGTKNVDVRDHFWQVRQNFEGEDVDLHRFLYSGEIIKILNDNDGRAKTIRRSTFKFRHHNRYTFASQQPYCVFFRFSPV